MAITWNPSDKSTRLTLSNGNLTCEANTTLWGSVRATISKSSGKWYWEILVDDIQLEVMVGVANSSAPLDNYCGADTNGWGYRSYTGANGQKIHNDSSTFYGDGWNDGHVIGVALDLDTGKIWFAKNNVWQESGNPAAGTNEAFSGLSGSLFPMGSCYYNYGAVQDTQTLKTTIDSQTYSPPSGFSPLGAPVDFLDGKIRIGSYSLNLLDGKSEIGIFADNTFSGKVIVGGEDTVLFNGTTEVTGWKADLLDGKTGIGWGGVVGWNADLPYFDGKANIANLSSKLFNGKVKINLDDTDLLDGKIKLYGIDTDLLDGKAIVQFISAINLLDGRASVQGWALGLLDGKIWIKELIEGNLDLPSLSVTGYTGAIGDVVLPCFDIFGEAGTGINAQGNLILPGLGVVGFTGARCSYNLSSLGISGTAVVGIAASGNIVLPIFDIEGRAFTDALVHGVFTLPALTVVASSIAGAVCAGEVTLPQLGINATAKVGTVCIGTVTLPCLIVEGTGGHIPIGNGNVILPLLQVYSTASILADPRDGCHILRYNRWR